ncbi:DUF2786 domain-containing protein [Quadrisphaera sp. INWT6]|uniref:DUF2786 domain-containing protein n=1 Tax=Quadrisphaera sp. INWT6 TaxID=2596917 RepID=UPI001892775D|nr:DUF2786 domain-containing protein [Quadrisphaera sp. INWT6]MBF5083363.1 DUF2786 domain-containing protein [Quadrisphaera sp. INWT6]
MGLDGWAGDERRDGDVERDEREGAWYGDPSGSGYWDDDPDEHLDDGADDDLDDGADDEVGELTAEAALAVALDELRRGSVAGATAVLAAAPETELVPLVAARVLESLERLWGDGWEPADVLRWARRRPGGATAPLLRLAVGASLARRPQVDLSPRWQQQAAAHDVEVREGTSGFLSEAGAGQRSSGWGRYGRVPAWAEVSAEALALVLALDRQEAMPVVGSGGGVASAAAGAADRRVLEKVRLLLAKAESTAFPAEAETFTAAAQSLISRHSLEAALAAGTSGGEAAPGGVRIGVDAPYEGQKAALLAAVARANRCSAVWTRHLGCSTVVGFSADLAAVEVLFASLLTQAVRGMTAAGADARPGASTRRPEFRRAYLESFARRIGQRLDEAATAAAAAGDLDDGGRLLPVLAARSAAVDDAVAQAFPQLVSRRGPRTLDRAGWASGWAAAELASLDVGQAVTSVRALPPSGAA